MSKKDKQVKELLEDASDFYAKNQYKEALKKYNEVLELDKDNNEAIFKKYVIEAYETTYARFEVERIVNKLIEIAPSCDNETLFKYVADAFIVISDLRDFAISVYDNNPFSLDDVNDLHSKIERCILAYKMLFNIAPKDEKNEISKMIIVTYDYLIKKKYYYSGFDKRTIKLKYRNKNIRRYKKERCESLQLLKDNSYDNYKELKMYYAIAVREKLKISNYVLLGISLLIICLSFFICSNRICLIFLILLYLIAIPVVSVNVFREKVDLELFSKSILFILGFICFVWFTVPMFVFNKTYYGLDKSKIILNVSEGTEIINKEKHKYSLDVKILDDYYEFKLGDNTYRYRYKNKVYYLCRVENNKCSTYFYDSNSLNKYIKDDGEFNKYFK